MSEGHGPRLPRGWHETSVGHLVGPGGLFCDGDWVESKDQDPSGDVRLIQLADVGDGQFRDRSNRFLTSARAAALRCTFLDPGDLLVARMPDPLGRVCVFPGDTKSSVTVVDVCVIRLASPVHARWLMHQLNTPQLRQRVAALQSGTTRKRISRINLAKIRFPLAPAPEQERIAVVADELFSELDAAVAALERVRAKLKLYRASVLKAAVEGALTAEWRAQHPTVEPASELLDRILAERRRVWEEGRLAKFKAKGQEPRKGWEAKYKAPATPTTATLPLLPKAWCWAMVGQLLEGIAAGKSFTCEPRPAALSEWAVVKVSAMTWGRFDEQENKAVPRGKAHDPAYEIRVGDLLLSRSNTAELVGASVLVEHTRPRLLLSDKSMRLRYSPLLDRRWLRSTLAAAPARDQMSGMATGTSDSMRNISQENVARLVVPLPPLAEQEAIVELVEDQMSVIDHLEADIDAQLKGAQSLRQAILRHAFNGKLVAQDPNDEPASELLKRIAAEREARVRGADSVKGKKPRRTAQRKKS